jgi:hypothetical protein
MKYDLEERLINYSVLILDIVDVLPDNRGANHLAGQIVRSHELISIFVKSIGTAIKNSKQKSQRTSTFDIP